MNLNTNDREDLPGDEGREERVETFEGEKNRDEFEETAGSRRSPVRTEILDARNKDPTLPSPHDPVKSTTPSIAIQNPVACRVPVATAPVLARGFPTMVPLSSPKVSGQPHPSA